MKRKTYLNGVMYWRNVNQNPEIERKCSNGSNMGVSTINPSHVAGFYFLLNCSRREIKIKVTARIPAGIAFQRSSIERDAI
jgi:hypothetical protein